MSKQISLTPDLGLCSVAAQDLACRLRHRILTPEHLLMVILSLPSIHKEMMNCSKIKGEPFRSLARYISEELNNIRSNNEFEIEEVIASNAFTTYFDDAAAHAISSSKDKVSIYHWLRVLFEDREELTFASTLLRDCLDAKSFGTWFSSILEREKAISEEAEMISGEEVKKNLEDMDEFLRVATGSTDEDEKWESWETDEFYGVSDSSTDWKSEVVCINDTLEGRNPLIGREEELERTIQILCRKDKNNPLHIGDPGVGKTALIYGLARMIEDGRVPERLKGAKIYQMDMGAMIAGTQYRGEFEEKLRRVLEGASAEGNAIIYIDEIHTMVGAGAVRDSSLDASNMLKKYLEGDKLRFIGATTYEEFKKSIQKHKALSRRFQEIEVKEPSEEEAIKILNNLIPGYSAYHGVEYSGDVAEYSVKMSRRHIHGRSLPDKAIDLIDEAGAYRLLHPDPESGEKIVDVNLLAEVLARVCKVDALAMKRESMEYCISLTDRLLKHVYGQDEAVRDVAEAVLMSQAGLTDEHKPMGSFLFVGPTGVGKTELAKMLAKEMGIGLVRFDMSEYAEKHTIAKLIGSPAGYVGYDDGGLLTDAIRKTPNCVLLLDEIEKAHPNIYNILLQVMDYATLTDNQGRTADFSNVILIMTSNAGAQHANKASVGFASRTSAGEAMLKEVKRVFKPEFLNRLSGIEVFHDMDREMARLILDKSLRALEDMLSACNINIEMDEDVREWLMDKGFTPEYGARELERVITRYLKKPLSKEILLGGLKNGGEVKVKLKGDSISIEARKGGEK